MSATNTANLFRLVIRALVELSDEDRDTVIQVAYGLMSEEKSNKHNPNVKLLHDTIATAAQAVRKHKAAKSKAEPKKPKKSPAKPMDAASILANRKGPKTKAPHPKTTNTPGTTERVLKVLSETDGKLTSVEVQEFAELTTKGGAAMCLSALYRDKYKGLHREPYKITLDSGKQVPGYLYWLDAEAKQAVKDGAK